MIVVQNAFEQILVLSSAKTIKEETGEGRTPGEIYLDVTYDDGTSYRVFDFSLDALRDLGRTSQVFILVHKEWK